VDVVTRPLSSHSDTEREISRLRSRLDATREQFDAEIARKNSVIEDQERVIIELERKLEQVRD
jgi:predicted RNase H-like nuclease (RuvC/YqgF family)